MQLKQDPLFANVDSPTDDIYALTLNYKPQSEPSLLRRVLV